MKKLISTLTTCSMMLSMVPIGVNAAANYTMTVNEGQNIKTVTGSMYGLNGDWAIGGVEDFVVDAVNHDFSPNIELKSTFADTKLPVIRWGEGASQKVLWKDTIGDYASRPEYTLWDVTGSIDFGLVEAIKFYQEIDPDVEFIITINMNDTAANAADLAEFLTGDKTTEWGSERAKYGIENPVRVKMYQLGNENDYIEPVMAMNDYVNKSKEIIDAIKVKDTDAVFGAIGGTALYTAYIRGEGYNDSWIKGVASALKNDLSYLTFNWYFKAGSAYQVNQLLDLVSASIKEATGSNRIKPCLTEFAESSYDQTVPYNLQGVLTTADFYIRSYNNTNIDTAVYHSLNSSSWKTAWYKNGKWGLTGIGMLQNMLKKYAEGDVVESSLTGYSANESSDISAVALKPDADTLNLVFVNFSNAEKTINLELGEGYKLVAEDVLKSEKSTPALTDITDGNDKKIVSYSYLYSDRKEINSYSLPAYSVCAMSFDKESNNSEIVFDFDDASLDYTLIQNAVDEGISATIENSKLVLDGYGDNGGTYENNYAYIPVTTGVDGNYTIKMDVTVNDIDAGSFGFVYGASDKVDLDTTGTGNIVLFTEEGVSESTYTNGSQTTCQNNTTNNAPSLAPGSTVNLQFDVNDTTLRVLADNKEIYSRQIDSAINMANIGLMYSDISVSIDKISIIQQKKAIDINKPFIYENNFDDVENGKLPAGFYKTAGNAKAYVENGALYIENDEWWTREGVLISGIGSVLNENAVIEADITMVSMDEVARANSAANMGGIIFGANGRDKASVGLHTFNQVVQIIDKNTRKTLPEISYTSEETPFHEGGTVALKVVCSKNTSPTIYINGNPLNYTKTSFDIGDTGYMGLYATASKMKIDNLKISGEPKSTYPETDIVTKTVDLNYAENFDGVSNGSLPFGWKLIDEAALAGSNETAVAKVENGALTFKATAWYTHSAYLLFDFDDVMRQGLTMECDITRISALPGNQNNAKAGLMYAGVEDESTGGMSNASYIAPQTGVEQFFAVRDFSTDAGWIAASNRYKVGEEPRSFDWSNRTKPVHLKIEFNNDTQSPEVYIDDELVTYTKASSNDENRIKAGKIGLYAYNTSVTIDNIVVSGKHTVKVPNEFSYEAAFASDKNVYSSVAKAEKNVILTEIDILGNRSRVSDGYTVSTQLIEGNQYKTTVTYNDFSAELPWTLNAVEKAFTYSEDFSSVSNGSLPFGWKLIDEAALAGSNETAVAKVENGALTFKATAWYRHSAYLLFDFDDVMRQGLTMECDITRISAPQGNQNNAKAGLMYAGVEDESTGGMLHASYVAPQTGVEQFFAVRDFRTDKVELAQSKVYTVGNETKSFNWSTRTEPVHLKIEFNNDTQSPEVYIDGEHVTYYNESSNDENRIKTGKIGLYAYNTSVTIDNIVVSGKRITDADDVDSVELLNSGYNTNTKEISAHIKVSKTDAANKNVYMALYSKSDNKLIKVSAVTPIGSNLASFEGDIKLENVESYNNQDYRVSIFVWDTQTMKPVGERIDLK